MFYNTKLFETLSEILKLLQNQIDYFDRRMNALEKYLEITYKEDSNGRYEKLKNNK